MKTFILLLTVAFSAAAQIDGPRLGMLIDGDQIQTIWGVPGVAVSSPLRAVGAKNATASPKQDYVLAVPSDGPGVLVISPDGSDRLVLSDFAGIDGFLFSPRGESVAVRRGTRVDVISGLPQRSEVVRSFDLAFGGEGLSKLALSDDGTAMLAVFPDGAYRLDDSGVSRLAVDSVVTAAFLPRSRDVVVAVQDKLVILRDGQDAVEIAAPGLAAKDIVATARFVVAIGSDFTVLDIAAGAVAHLAPEGDMRAVQSAGDVLFYLTADGCSALDLTEQEPRLVRVPKRNVNVEDAQ